jgi:hypothetical protein
MCLDILEQYDGSIYYGLSINCSQQDRQYIRAIIVAVEKQKYHILIVCRLRYPECNVPYCHLWYARLYNIFPHYQKRHDFQ